MITRDLIVEALRPINDPEIHRSIVDLGMVRDITIDGGNVAVEIALTVAGCPLKDFFMEAVPKALSGVEGVTGVKVVLGAMTPEERAALGASLGSSPAESPFAGSKTRVVAVGSGKGGVGKSTIAVNLAAALTKQGYTVGLLDADVWGFSAPRMLGTHGRPSQRDGKIVPIERHGLRAISMGMFLPEEQPVIWRGPMLHKALTQFIGDVDWQEPDFLIVDMPPGTGDVTISLAQILPEARMVVVTTPQAAAQKVAERAARVSEQTKTEILGVIENMSSFHCPTCGHDSEIFGAGGGEELARSLGVPLLGRIPLDPRIRDLGDAGEPFVLADPDSIPARACVEAAERIAGWLGVFAEKRVFVSIAPRRPVTA